MRRVGDVTRHQHGSAARFLYPAHALACIFLFRKIGDKDIGSLARERNGDGPANAAVASGDDGHLAGEAAESLVGLLAMIWLWVHRRGVTRHLGLLLL